MEKGLSINLIKYELRNSLSNFMQLFFGIIFPIFMGYLIYIGGIKDMPKEIHSTFGTVIYTGMPLIICNAIILIGYGANFSVELSEKAILRLKLFGFSEKTVILGKLISQFIILTLGFFIYSIAMFMLIEIKTPTVSGAIVYYVSLYLLAIIIFLLSHGIANIFQKFGSTFAVSMTVFFLTQTLAGLMGLQVNIFPRFLQNIAYSIPYYYVAQDFHKVWLGESYNFVPFIQSMIFFAALSIFVLLFSFYLRRRKK